MPPGGMWTKVTDLDTPFAKAGMQYRVSIEGMERPDRTWAGRIVFSSATGTRVTEQETSQPNRKAIEYWATGLEPVYLDGAFGRARKAGENR